MPCLGKLRLIDSERRLRQVLLCLYVLTLVTSLVTCTSLYWAVRIFTGQCPLRASMRLSLNHNNSVTLDDLGTAWGESLVCNFCTFAAVLGTILSIMWFWFYVLLSDFTPEELHCTKVLPDTRLLLPSMVVNIAMFNIALVVASMITDGRAFLCRQVHFSIGEECNVVGTIEWLHPTDGRAGWNYIRVAECAAWGWVIFLLCTILVGAFRVHHLIQARVEAFFSLGSPSSSTASIESRYDDEYYNTTSEDSGDDVPSSQSQVHDSGEAVVERTRSRDLFLDRVEEEEEEDMEGVSDMSALAPLLK